MAEYDTDDEVLAAFRAGDDNARKRKPSRDTKATGLAILLSSMFWSVYLFAAFQTFPNLPLPAAVIHVLDYAILYLTELIPALIWVYFYANYNFRALRMFIFYLLFECLLMPLLWLLLLVRGAVRQPTFILWAYYAILPGSFVFLSFIAYFFSDTLRGRMPRPTPLDVAPEGYADAAETYEGRDP